MTQYELTRSLHDRLTHRFYVRFQSRVTSARYFQQYHRLVFFPIRNRLRGLWQ